MGNSKYTAQERMEIGRRIYEHEYTAYTAAARYKVSPYTARDYLRIYKAPKDNGKVSHREYEDMTREELIEEIIALKADR